MKKLVITSIAVFAVGLIFAQDHGREGVRVDPKTGQKEKVVYARPHKEAKAEHIADVRKDEPHKKRMTNIEKKARPVAKNAKAKHQHQHKNKMTPKGNFKTK